MLFVVIRARSAGCGLGLEAGAIGSMYYGWVCCEVTGLVVAQEDLTDLVCMGW